MEHKHLHLNSQTLRFLKILLASVFACAFLYSCNDSDEFIEDTALISKLKGTWTREFTSQSDAYIIYNLHQITFDEGRVSWHDSIAVLDQINPNASTVQTMTGSCPVLYASNDGVEHHKPTDMDGYSFAKLSGKEILWVLTDQFTENNYKEYTMSGSVFTFKSEFESSPHYFPVQTSSVVFSNDQKTVTFCEPRDTKWCYDFLRK